MTHTGKILLRLQITWKGIVACVGVVGVVGVVRKRGKLYNCVLVGIIS